MSLITFSPNTVIKSADINANFKGVANGSLQNAMTSTPLMASGTQGGVWGNASAELPAMPVRQSSAANLYVGVPIYYQVPFTSQPTVQVTGLVMYLNNANVDKQANCTVTIVHLTSGSNYIGFIASILNNTDLTSNTHAFVGFSWSATVSA